MFNLEIISDVTQAGILLAQIVVMVIVGRMPNQTSRNERFTKYDNDLNLILLEFYNCQKEVIRLKGELNKFFGSVHERIESIQERKTSTAIIEMRPFLEQLKIPIQFNEFKEKEYVFLIKEKMSGTIWNNTWKKTNLVELNRLLHKYIINVISLNRNQKQLQVALDPFFEYKDDRYVPNNNLDVFKRDEQNVNLRKLIEKADEMNKIIEEIEKIYDECKKTFPCKSSISKLLNELSDNYGDSNAN